MEKQKLLQNVEAKTVNSANSNEPKKGRGKSRKSAFALVIEWTKKMFDSQALKNTESKRACLIAKIAQFFPDPPRFAEEFRLAVDEILDRKSFNDRCVAEGLDAKIVAEHLMLEDKDTREAVLKSGFAPLKGRQRMWTVALITDDFYATDIFRAKE